ncbi:MAG TPA: flagellar biosynthesis anti-sigma factor FlgM [Oleiagrimonas sp.]|nr:flagellar biosynthesis anti-sigma factor FlgM [Oleiagrimonas sp.]
MKIDNVTHLPVLKQVDQSQGKDKPAPANADAGTTVQSSAATHLHQSGTDASHDIDHVRVAELRQAIAEGRLKIDTDRIADRLLAGIRELDGTSP